jgi:hypothetical protein
VALNPPSRLRTQLLAYLFVARNTAASAISEGSPKRLRGMAFRAAECASGVMAVLCILESNRPKDDMWGKPKGIKNVVYETIIPLVILVSTYPGTMTFTRMFFSPSSVANARVKAGGN